MRWVAMEPDPAPMFTPRVKSMVARAPRWPWTLIDWPACEPDPSARLAPTATWVLTRGRHPPLPVGPAKVPSRCVADEPVAKALLTPTVTLVLESGQPRLASIKSSVASGLL